MDEENKDEYQYRYDRDTGSIRIALQKLRAQVMYVMNYRTLTCSYKTLGGVTQAHTQARNLGTISLRVLLR